MPWWAWLLLLAYIPLAALQGVWLGLAIEQAERRERGRPRNTRSSGHGERFRKPCARGTIRAAERAELPPGAVGPPR